MSVHVSSWAWKLPLADPKMKLVLLKFADSANDDGYCWPALKTIARDTGLGVSTVQRRIKLLIELGFLEKERRREGQRETSVMYRVTPKSQPAVEMVSVNTSSQGSGGQNDGFSGGQSLTNEPSVEQPSGSRPNGLERARPRDQAWDALVEIFGEAPAGKTTARGRWNRAAADLNAMGASSTEILEAAATYRRHPTFRECALTPLALAANFPTLKADGRPASPQQSRADDLRRRMDERGIE